LELLADQTFKKTFRLSSGREIHDITLKFGATRGAVEVDGQPAVTVDFSRKPLQPYHLRTLSSTLGSDVIIQWTTTWDAIEPQHFAGGALRPYFKRIVGPCFKRPVVSLLILRIGDQVLRYYSPGLLYEGLLSADRTLGGLGGFEPGLVVVPSSSGLVASPPS
jgi:hypothetical protein